MTKMARALHLPLLVVLASAISTCASPTAQAARARRSTWQLGDAAEEATKEWSSTYASGGVEKLVGCNDLQYDLANAYVEKHPLAPSPFARVGTSVSQVGLRVAWRRCWSGKPARCV